MLLEAIVTGDVKIVPIPGDPRTVLVKHGKSMTERAVAVPIRSHKVLSVEDAIAVAKQAAQPGHANSPEVWHSPNKIVVVLDAADRRDTATMAFECSTQYAKLCELETRGPLDQKKLISLLRVDFAGCIDLPGLLTSVRKIKFRASTSGESNVQHGNESLGKSVEAEVSGVDAAFPEEVVVKVPVYRNYGEDGFRTSVVCALEIDPPTQTFSFRPLGGEITRAMHAAQESIGARLRDGVGETVPVYFGEP